MKIKNKPNFSLITKDVENIKIHDKETINDLEGTPINISPSLTLDQHAQVISLLKEFIHVFTTDTSRIRPANVLPCQIQLKSNYKEPKFNAPHRVSPQLRDELET